MKEIALYINRVSTNKYKLNFTELIRSEPKSLLLESLLPSRESSPVTGHTSTFDGSHLAISKPLPPTSDTAGSLNQWVVSEMLCTENLIPVSTETNRPEQTFKPLSFRQRKEAIFDGSDEELSKLFSGINVENDPNDFTMDPCLKSGEMLRPQAVYLRQLSVPGKIQENSRDIDTEPYKDDCVVRKRRKRQRPDMPESTDSKFSSFPKRHHLHTKLSPPAITDAGLLFSHLPPLPNSPQQHNSLPFNMKFGEDSEIDSDNQKSGKA